MPDIGDIAAEIGSVVGDAAGAVGDELKKISQSASSQITGSSPGGSDTVSQTANDSPSVLDELKKLGTSAVGQVSGGENYTNDQIKSMAKSDKRFSDKSSAEVRARIKRIYDEYAQKRAREKQQQVQVEQVDQLQKKEDQVQEEQNRQGWVNPAIEKAKAEIKNYGAE